MQEVNPSCCFYRRLMAIVQPYSNPTVEIRRFHSLRIGPVVSERYGDFSPTILCLLLPQGRLAATKRNEWSACVKSGPYFLSSLWATLLICSHSLGSNGVEVAPPSFMPNS
jgi:hypothetical protein